MTIQMSWPRDFVVIVFFRSIQLFLFCLQKFPAKESTTIMKEKGSCKLVLKLMGGGVGWHSMCRPGVSGLHARQSPRKVPVTQLAGPLERTHDSCLEGVSRPQSGRGQPHLNALRAVPPSGAWIRVAWDTGEGKEDHREDRAGGRRQGGRVQVVFRVEETVFGNKGL